MTPQPLVSCIMPTCDRAEYIPKALRHYLAQDYANKELIIIDDGRDSVARLIPQEPNIRYVHLDRKETVGAKRNIACELSRGEIVVHWDDDDWYAPDWVSRQLLCLQQTGADICGLDRVLFYAPLKKQAWRYEYDGRSPWVIGSTFAYRRELWQSSPFADISVGEDNAFVWAQRQKKLVAHTYQEGFVGFVHAGNTSPKDTLNRRWKAYPAEMVEKIMAT